MQRFKLDLGIPALAREWVRMFSPRDLWADVAAGLTVACIAVPLSLAIALASGVPPAVGIITAIVGGIVCAFFGGVRLQVSGPAAAMAVLIASIVQEQGMAALLVVGLGCGLLQVATGVLRLGRFVRLVPMPVVEGFTAGIGAIILIGQLPRALGLPPPPQSHVFDVITHIAELMHKASPAAIGITLMTLAIIFGLPRISKKLPASLIAVVGATVASLWLNVTTIGEIPRSLPLPHLPLMPASFSALLAPTLAVFALATLETLLSASAVEKLAPEGRGDPDQELIGQGIGNTISAMFGGIAVTGVIARSATNVQAGAKTRRAAIIHAFVLILGVLVLAPAMAKIPVAALAGVLFSVAFRMLSPTTFVKLWRHSRADGLVFALTFAVIVFVDLLEGVQWGVFAALVIAAIRLGRAKMVIRGVRAGDHHMFVLEGSLTFLSSLEFEKLRTEISAIASPDKNGVLIDVRDIRNMDASGAEMLVGILEHAEQLGMKPMLIGLAGEHRERFLSSARDPKHFETMLASTERDALDGATRTTAELRLRTGIERYRRTVKPLYADLFESLADGQKPHTLFITCSDSRINPAMITNTDPGELFLVRNIGNVVLPVGTLAAIEYAVGVLGVAKIVVCGHSGCGAIQALMSDAELPYPNLTKWLEQSHAREMLKALPQSISRDEAARLNVLAQLDHLVGQPLVMEKLQKKELSVAAWFFDVKSGELEEWSSESQAFAPVGLVAPASMRPPVVGVSHAGHTHSHSSRNGAAEKAVDTM